MAPKGAVLHGGTRLSDGWLRFLVNCYFNIVTSSPSKSGEVHSFSKTYSGSYKTSVFFLLWKWFIELIKFSGE